MFNSQVVSNDRITGDVDQENEDLNLNSEDDVLNSDDTFFLQQKLFLLPNKNISKRGEKYKDSISKEIPVKPKKVKTNNFIILRRHPFFKNNNKITENPFNKLVTNSTNISKTLKNNSLDELKINNSIKIYTYPSENIDLHNISVPKIQQKITHKTSDLKRNSTKNKNLTIQILNRTKDTRNSVNNSVNIESRNFSTITKEFLLNFYNQVKGQDGINKINQIQIPIIKRNLFGSMKI